MSNRITLDLRLDNALLNIGTALSILQDARANGDLGLLQMAIDNLYRCEKTLETVVNDPRIAILDVGDDDDDLQMLLELEYQEDTQYDR